MLAAREEVKYANAPNALWYNVLCISWCLDAQKDEVADVARGTEGRIVGDLKEEDDEWSPATLFLAAAIIRAALTVILSRRGGSGAPRVTFMPHTFRGTILSILLA